MYLFSHYFHVNFQNHMMVVSSRYLVRKRNVNRDYCVKMYICKGKELPQNPFAKLHSCCSCCYTHQSFKAISQSSCHFCIGFYCCCEKNHLTTSSWVFCICKIGFSLHTQKARLHIDCWTLQHRLMLLALHTDHKICSNLCVSSKQASKQALSGVCVFFPPFVSCTNFPFCLLASSVVRLLLLLLLIFSFILLLLWVVGCISFCSLFCLKEFFVWCWCCSGLQLLVEGLCCLFVILFAFGELGVVLFSLCLSVVSSLNLLSLWSFL